MVTEAYLAAGNGKVSFLVWYPTLFTKCFVGACLCSFPASLWSLLFKRPRVSSRVCVCEYNYSHRFHFV